MTALNTNGCEVTAAFLKKKICIYITHREQKEYQTLQVEDKEGERELGKIIFLTLMRLKVRTDTHK